MRNSVVVALLLAGMSISAPAWTRCEGASNTSEPDWVSQPDYSLPGYFVGVGSAESSGKSQDEQSKAAENNAQRHLVQQIEVTIKNENEQNISVSNDKVSRDASSKVTVSAEEVVRDLRIKDRWRDKNCTQHILMIASKESVAKAKHEKTMKNRLAKFKELLAEGRDENKNREIKVRRKYLEEAQALLPKVDFTLLPDELESSYVNHLDEALALVHKETSKVVGRTALFAMKSDDTIPQSVLDKMLDRLRAANGKSDRLMGCSTQEECIGKAKEMGFSALALLKVSGQVGVTAMGSSKGTIKIIRTVYDVDSPKLEKSRQVGTAQVIGWGNEELNWDAAAEKAMEDWK